MILLFDHDLRYLFAEGTGLAELNLSSEQVEGKTLQEMVSPELYTRLEPIYRAALAGTPDTIEVSFAMHDYLLHVLPFRTDRGDIAAGQVICQDITADQCMIDVLHVQDAEYHALFEQNNDAVFLVSLEGTCLDANWRAADLLGYTVSEMLSMTFEQLLSAAELTRHRQVWQQLLAKRPVPVYECAFRKKDGTTWWAEVNLALGQDATGVPQLAQYILRDIGERKQTEHELRQSEARYRAITEDQTDMIIRFLQDGSFTFVNEVYCHQMGSPRDTLMQQNLADLISSDKRAIFRNYIATLTPDKPLGKVELHIKMADGDYHWVQWITHGLIDDQGHITEYQAVGHDITDLKKAEAILRISETRYRAIVEDQTELVCRFTPRYQLTFINEAGCRYFQQNRESLIGHSFFVLVPSIEQPLVQSQTARLSPENPVISCEHRAVPPGGEPGWLQWTIRALFDDQGAPVEFQAVGRDVTEHKRAEAALQESEQRFRQLSNAAFEAILIHDHGMILDVNQVFCEMYGAERPAILGRSVFEFVPPAYHDVLRQRMTASDLRPCEVQAIRHDGATFWVEIAARPMTYLGRLVRVTAIRDVGERKRAEEALRQSEAAEREQRILAESLRDTAAALTSSLDPYVVMTRILENIGRVVPHDAANIMLIQGQAGQVLVHHGYPPILDERIRMFPRALEEFPHLHLMMVSRQPYLVADTASDPNWSKEFVPGMDWIRSDVGAPILAHGEVIGFINLDSHQPGFFTPAHAERLRAFADQAAVAVENAQLYDQLRAYAAALERRVTERTAELHRAKERAEAIFGNSSDAIIVAHADGAISQANPALGDMFIYQPKKVIGWSVIGLAQADSADALSAAFHTVVTGGKPARIEIIACRQDGSTFNADVVLSPITQYLDAEARTAETCDVVCSIRDITERKRFEHELKELNRLKTEFLSTAAHELRTPLTSIRGFSELLVTRELDPERTKRYIALISDQARALAHLIDDLLDIVRLEEKRQLSLVLQPFDIAGLIEETLTPFAESSPEHTIQKSGLDTCPVITGDRFRLGQVINNLISNAVKYSPEGGTITVSACQGPGAVVVSVSDEGIGMTPEQLAHLFEKFYRANASNTAIRGTGLGLAISKLIVELHGGQIWARSEPNAGTTVYFSLPVCEKG